MRTLEDIERGMKQWEKKRDEWFKANKKEVNKSSIDIEKETTETDLSELFNQIR